MVRSKSPKKSWDNSGQLGTSRNVLPDMTTKVPGPKIPRSSGTTRDIPGCPQTQLPMSQVRSLGTTRDIPGCPTRHDYQSPRSKDPKKSWGNSGHPMMSYHDYQNPRPRSTRTSWWDVLMCDIHTRDLHYLELLYLKISTT